MNYKIDETAPIRVRAESEIKLCTKTMNITLGYPKKCKCGWNH